MTKYANQESLLKHIYKDALETRTTLKNKELCITYYTNIETALKILNNAEIWMRSCLLMNDYSELAYGNHLLYSYLNSAEGDFLREAINKHLTISQTNWFESKYLDDMLRGVYITSTSLHSQSDLELGRLSMWRAYGTIAFVFNYDAFDHTDDTSKLFSAPVKYQTQQEFNIELEDDLNIFQKNLEHLDGDLLYNWLLNKIITTKHPGFKEETEWRVVHIEGFGESPALECKTEMLYGIPQRIYKIPLKNAPDLGMHSCAPNDLINRIIIGPTKAPTYEYGALLEAMGSAKIENAHEKISISNIPFRKEL